MFDEMEEIAEMMGMDIDEVEASIGMYMPKREFINIGPVPNAESCVQAGSPLYQQLQSVETKAYLNQLKRMFPQPPEGCEIRSKRFDHHSGYMYDEVVVYYPEDCEVEVLDWVADVEGGAENWDKEALKELGKNNYKVIEINDYRNNRKVSG